MQTSPNNAPQSSAGLTHSIQKSLTEVISYQSGFGHFIKSKGFTSL